jgi:hypothetical protein
MLYQFNPFTGTLDVVNDSTELGNGVIINGVANFYQTTKPITRVDGSALVVGDRWYKTNDGTEWFWNGTYWLSSTLNVRSGTVLIAGYSNSLFAISEGALPTTHTNFFVEKVGAMWDCSLITEVNYWQLQVSLHVFPNSATTILPTFDITTDSGRYEIDKNTAYDLSDRLTPGIRVWAFKIGSPGALQASEYYTYRLILP